MKTSFRFIPKWQIALSCFVLLLANESAMAQNATNTNLDTEIFYYAVALTIIILVATTVLIVTTVLILRKVQRILGEYGQPLFNPGFSIFKRMTKASTFVAIVMILLVLWGIYLVITYKAT